MTKALKFGAAMTTDWKDEGVDVFETTVPFNEREIFEKFADLIK
jgi:hypothetical protein